MGRLTSGQGWPWRPTAPIDTREETPDNSPVGSKRGQNIVGKRTGGRSAPTTVNSSVRTREYLTMAEIERLMAAARKSSRYGHRDATMILIGYRHGLRASELCDLQWSQVPLPDSCTETSEVGDCNDLPATLVAVGEHRREQAARPRLLSRSLPVSPAAGVPQRREAKYLEGIRQKDWLFLQRSRLIS